VRTEIFFTASGAKPLEPGDFPSALQCVCCIVAGRDRAVTAAGCIVMCIPIAPCHANTAANSFTSVSPDNGVSFVIDLKH